MTVVELQQNIQSIYPSAVFMKDYTVTTDSNGSAVISLWNNNLGPQPTDEQLSEASVAVLIKQAQSAQVQKLQASYLASRYEVPVLVTLHDGVEYKFPTDKDTQSNVGGYNAAFKTPEKWPVGGLPLMDAFGNVQMLTFDDAEAIAQAIVLQSVQVWKGLKSLIAQVMSATTIAEIQAVVWPTP